jgi:hypothetical protein
MCVFGHYHVSYGVERAVWRNGMDSDMITKSTIMTGHDVGGIYDFTDMIPGEESVFVNAAWMSGEKRLIEKMNRPVVIDLNTWLLTSAVRLECSV